MRDELSWLIIAWIFLLQLLREVGFEEVSVEDRTKQFGEILECELKNFEKTKDEFVKVRRCTG